jgi:hypothetical protein
MRSDVSGGELEAGSPLDSVSSEAGGGVDVGGKNAG